MFNFKKKVLFGLSVSLVLAMAVGSFAISETQANNTTEVTAGAFTISGEDPTLDQDYTFSGTTGTNGLLTIISGKEMTIKNTSMGETNDRIKVDLTSDSEANITLDGVNINTDQGSAFEIKDDATFNVNILLADDTINILKGKAGTGILDPGSAGIQKNNNDNTPSANFGTLVIAATSSNNSNGNGILEATGGLMASGIGSQRGGEASNIEITSGTVKAHGGMLAAGIGGGSFMTSGGETAGGYAENINIKGGNITATGGSGGAGIGCGTQAAVNKIYISGGEVEATGIDGGAGIGGGLLGEGNEISISGGIVKAIGGNDNLASAAAAGVGSGANGTASRNKLSGNAVLLAASGAEGTSALDGFADSECIGGIAFTGFVTDATTDPITISWDESGKMYGTSTNSVEISRSVEFPSNLTIKSGDEIRVNKDATLTIPDGVTLAAEDGAKLTISDGAKLINDGTIPDGNTVVCDGIITTKTEFYREGSTDVYKTGYQTYMTKEGVQKYKNLPNPDNPGPENDVKFISWYYLDASQNMIMIDGTKPVLPNKHTFNEYRAETYNVKVAELENGQIKTDKDEAAEGFDVNFEVIPAEGYQLQEGSLKVMAGTTSVTVTKGADGKYKFTMLGSEVTISAVFEQIPDPTPTPPKPTPTPPGPEPTPTPPGPQPGPEPTPTPTPEPTPDPSVNPDGDGSGSSSKTSDPFMGGVALALLGVATTGAILTRKLK